jgi:hypothetical protein
MGRWRRRCGRRGGGDGSGVGDEGRETEAGGGVPRSDLDRREDERVGEWLGFWCLGRSSTVGWVHDGWLRSRPTGDPREGGSSRLIG